MAEREYIVHIGFAADERIVDHVNFLAQVSISASERLSDNLGDAIESLDYNPEMYPVYTAAKKADIVFRHKLYTKRYRIVFEIDGNDVYVHDVQDCRQDTDKHLV